MLHSVSNESRPDTARCDGPELSHVLFMAGDKGAMLKEIQEAGSHETIASSAKYVHLSPEHNKGEGDGIAGIAQSRTHP